jgi:hypothetical protein
MMVKGLLFLLLKIWRRRLNLMQKLRRLFPPDFPWSLGVALGMIIYFAQVPELHGDLLAFRTQAEAMRHPYYARWLFELMAVPSEPVAFWVLSLTCTAMLYFSVRVFGGKHWMVFTSFAFAWTTIYGQIDGLVVGALAFAWWALNRGNPWLVGAGLALASIKPQLALPIGLAIWWWTPGRLKALLIPLVVFGLSLLQWGWWVPAWLAELQNTPDLVGLSRNLSWLPQLGGWVLLIWPVVLLAKLPRPRKIILLAAATALTVPYFPLPSAVLFLVMPAPLWVYILLQLPALAGFGFDWLYVLARVVPAGYAIWAAWPWLTTLTARWRSRGKPVGNETKLSTAHTVADQAPENDPQSSAL